MSNFLNTLLHAGLETDGMGGLHTIIAGATQQFAGFFFKSASLADDASFNLPDATDGLLIVFEGAAEGGVFGITAAGVVIKLAGTTNAVATDTDVKLCVFDGGTAATVRNRMGGARTVTAMYFYKTS